MTHAPATALYDASVVALKAVVPNPGKIICIGLNYRDHAIEVNLPIPTVPTIFAKYTNTLIGHGEAIVIPRVKQLRARDPRGARDAVEAHIRRSASAFLAFLDSSSAA